MTTQQEPTSLAQQLRSQMVRPSVDAIVAAFAEAVETYAAANRSSNTFTWLREFEFDNANQSDLNLADAFNKVFPTLKPLGAKRKAERKAKKATSEQVNKDYIFRNCDNVTVVQDLIDAVTELGFKDVEVGGTCGGVFFEPSEPWISTADRKSLCCCDECPQSVPEFAVMGIRVSW